MRTTQLEFVDGTRTFTCSVEPCRTSPTDSWWWFRVSSERYEQRYAPFRKEPGDTAENVKARIVRYFDDLLVRRAAPPTPRWGGGGPGRKPASATVAVPAAQEEETA